MQVDLDSSSLTGQRIGLPVPRLSRGQGCQRILVNANTPISELEHARQTVLRARTGEQLAWLALALSALATLGLSFWL